MNLKIINSETELLCPGWMLKEAPIKKRIDVQQRFGKPGATVSGDREISSRPISLDTDITAESDPEYISKMGDIVRIFDKNKSPYFLVDTDNDRECEVELDQIVPSSQQGLEMIWTPVRVDLVMVESFWEDSAATEVESESAGLATGESLQCENIGDVDCYPIIAIMPQSINSAFSLINNTTNDILTIGTNSFVPGISMIVDCQLGEIYLDDGTSQIEISASIADGSGFLFLAPGINDIQYDSSFDNIDITIEFKNRYAF